jgi:hypothetical protein
VHIALLFSGHKRSFLKHAERWREMIKELEANGAVVNCFFHSWTVDCHAEMRGNQRIEGSYVKSPLTDQQEMVNALPFRHYFFEDEDKAEASLVLPKRAFLLDKQAAKKHIGLQLYSMQRSYEAMIQWEKKNNIEHSTIVKLRFDTAPAHWSVREFFLSTDHRFKKLLIAANEHAHPHPGGGGGCVKCQRLHNDWWKHCWKEGKEETEPDDELWQHEGAHSNDICDLYAIGNRETMARYMTVYSRVVELYSPELFERSYQRWHNEKRKGAVACPYDENDLKAAAWGMEMEDEHFACFYPERLQRLNLEGFAVLHAASIFHRD